MTSPQKFTRPSLYGTTPLTAAIARFIDADNRSFIQNATIEEAVRNGATEADLTLRRRNAQNATNDMNMRFASVIGTASEELHDVLKKLQLWTYVTNCTDPTDDNHSPSERLIASAANDLDALLRSAGKR